MGLLEDKVVVVTGAGRGIGRGEALECARQGAAVVVAEFDAVINNAGILRDRTLVKMSDAEWDDVIRVHLRGHFAPTRAACRYWRESERPRHVVHTASASGILGNFG